MYSVYMLLPRFLALKTKEATTLPPNDFEKNERFYVNEKEKKEK